MINRNMGKNRGCSISLRLFLFFIFFVFLINFGGSGIQDNPRFGGIFRIKSFVDQFRMQLDPIMPESFIFISEQIYDGLVKLDKNLNIVPCLAEYWKISADGRTYTFYLRKGIKFHHGGELTAEDVKFSLERIIDKRFGSPYYPFFLQRVIGAEEFREGKEKEVRGFKALDKYTFAIYWKKPFISSLYLLSMHFCKILSKDLVMGHERGFFRKPSGTGPFVFDYWIRDTRLKVSGVRLKRNDKYFDGMPFLEAVEFCPLYTLDHFLEGEIDSIPVVSEKLLKADYQIIQDGSLQQVFLGISCHIPPLDNPIVRRAISHGINKDEIVLSAADIRYSRIKANNYIPPKLRGFFPVDEDLYGLDKAKRLLKEAGFFQEGKFPTLTLFFDLPRMEFKFKIYRKLKGQLRELGIDLSLNFYKSLEEIRKYKRPYLIVTSRLMNIPDPEDIIRPLFFSKSNLNIFGYENNELDRLLQEAEVERSWTKRNNLFHSIEQILFSDVPAVPLFSQDNRVAMQPYVRGVKVPPLGLYYLEARKIWLDK